MAGYIFPIIILLLYVVCAAVFGGGRFFSGRAIACAIIGTVLGLILTAGTTSTGWSILLTGIAFGLAWVLLYSPLMPWVWERVVNLIPENVRNGIRRFFRITMYAIGGLIVASVVVVVLIVILSIP